MNKCFLAVLSLVFFALLANGKTPQNELFSIGNPDQSAAEFALAPNGYNRFLANDFGYEDRFFMVGFSNLKSDFPYVLPGPTDTWGGTWVTSGKRTNQINILFDLDTAPEKRGYELHIGLADFAKKFLPLVKVSVNSQDEKFQLVAEGYVPAKQPKPTLSEPIVDTLSITGNLSEATPYDIVMPLDAGTLRKGANEMTITVLEGSWILFDRISITGPKGAKINKPVSAFVRSIEAADYQIGNSQPLIVDIEHLAGNPLLEVMLDGRNILSQKLDSGRYKLEAPMPEVAKPTKSKYAVAIDGQLISSGEIERAPKPQQTPADYVDTRWGTAHSRWMIAPGPWMPFGMVKISPDNQNGGWMGGYDPSFENVGCFSHIHEWTLGGLGIMAANGDLKVRVGDEQHPDEGYRSRIDKRTEQAGIGCYSADLTDYGIKAEVSATTRCSIGRFTFPADHGEGRILVELRPEAEYEIFLKDLKVTKMSPTRIEGYCHQFSPNVWSSDAEQDYTVNFVIEVSEPMLSMGYWLNDEIKSNVDSLVAGECNFAGVFMAFDPRKTPVVEIRTGISPVSIANAVENLNEEIVKPFGWNFEAVVDNQKEVWNGLFARLKIKSNDYLEKQKFYNAMYRSLCSRNIWSDINGEWISTDGKKHRVANPEKDRMIGCDAFWNTFWNLNQFWNLVTPEWSSRWVGSQLALYDANGWLAKGPAGLNYIPVMVGEHEIPLIVSAWQMGIRDFDGKKALEAAVKMQTNPGQKVYKGFAGNRDLATYIKHKYVPYDQGRFSNTMEYSFDDWAVGQLAKSLGDTAVCNIFNDRGYWWRNAIDDEGYCHMRDSNGKWLEDFDPFRSGANNHYVEGNAWQLTFFVPQDVPALIEKVGKKRFTDRLTWGFNQDEAWRYNAPNDQYWDHPVVQGNQQSMHFAYLFNFAGQPWNTQRWSRSILDRYYGKGVANAYLGDEDQGQMSAWAVMTSLGLFQTDGGTSATPTYEIASPVFEEVIIDLSNRYGRGDKFIIKAENASRKNIYVQSAELNGRPLNSFRFPAEELLKGGELKLVMGPGPNKNWGAIPESTSSDR